MNILVTPAILISAAILAVLLARAIHVVRQEAKSPPPRGTEPGEGVTLIDASYISGGPGGGHSAQIAVPKDPQEYARAFVPDDVERKDR